MSKIEELQERVEELQERVEELQERVEELEASLEIAESDADFWRASADRIGKDHNSLYGLYIAARLLLGTRDQFIPSDPWSTRWAELVDDTNEAYRQMRAAVEKLAPMMEKK